jgi:hypothetical protein
VECTRRASNRCSLDYRVSDLVARPEGGASRSGQAAFVITSMISAAGREEGSQDIVELKKRGRQRLFVLNTCGDRFDALVKETKRSRNPVSSTHSGAKKRGLPAALAAP